MSEIANRVKILVSAHLGTDLDKTTDEARLGENLGADSLDCVELVMAVEEEFTIEIEDDDAEKCQTVGDIIKLVEQETLAQAEKE